ncbi:hypothetical protein Dimus_009567 [Dionaea muscipula]
METDEYPSKKQKHHEDFITSASTIDPVEFFPYDPCNTDLLNDDDGHYNADDHEHGGDDSFIDDHEDDGDDSFISCDDDDDDYLKLQAQFDNVDLPPGVEASVPWLENLTPNEAQSSFVGAVSVTASAATSSKAIAEPSSNVKEEEEMDDALRKLMYFKKFDTVEDYSDHHFASTGSCGKQHPKSWAKKIMEEWKILEHNLPDTIFVRVYEARMDLLRAVIVGPAGTPYHDGLFFFDVTFPPQYPSVPPMVHYYSGGLRLNPNLYECGKVCLSLLGTWSGRRSSEKWIPEKSTMLQVLVSIQALILNEQPFFNEPGYEEQFVGAVGERKSKEYNEQVFLLSMKTMLYTIRRPLKHFKDLVVGHFRLCAHDILTACVAYSEGAPVGCDIKKRVEDGDKGKSCVSPTFRANAKNAMMSLTSAFIINGAKDCEKFATMTF